ncbi:MAG: PilZ domain-containing protein [Nitrospiraceae bacterium]|nr:MAG: PilZ domain-containing protein [Nitrospiraceae bacterium]
MSKRFSERISVSLEFYCHDLAFSGTILNISGNGMLISSDNIEFPLQKDEVKVNVKVNRLVKGKKYYDLIAVELIHPSHTYLDFVEDLKRCQKFLDKFNITINSN